MASSGSIGTAPFGDGESRLATTSDETEAAPGLYELRSLLPRPDASSSATLLSTLWSGGLGVCACVHASLPPPLSLTLVVACLHGGAAGTTELLVRVIDDGGEAPTNAVTTARLAWPLGSGLRSRPLELAISPAARLLVATSGGGVLIVDGLLPCVAAAAADEPASLSKLGVRVLCEPVSLWGAASGSGAVACVAWWTRSCDGATLALATTKGGEIRIWLAPPPLGGSGSDGGGGGGGAGGGAWLLMRLTIQGALRVSGGVVLTAPAASAASGAADMTTSLLLWGEAGAERSSERRGSTNAAADDIDSNGEDGLGLEHAAWAVVLEDKGAALPEAARRRFASPQQPQFGVPARLPPRFGGGGGGDASAAVATAAASFWLAPRHADDQNSSPAALFFHSDGAPRPPPPFVLARFSPPLCELRVTSLAPHVAGVASSFVGNECGNDSSLEAHSLPAGTIAAALSPLLLAAVHPLPLQTHMLPPHTLQPLSPLSPPPPPLPSARWVVSIYARRSAREAARDVPLLPSPPASNNDPFSPRLPPLLIARVLLPPGAIPAESPRDVFDPPRVSFFSIPSPSHPPPPPPPSSARAALPPPLPPPPPWSFVLATPTSLLRVAPVADGGGGGAIEAALLNHSRALLRAPSATSHRGGSTTFGGPRGATSVDVARLCAALGLRPEVPALAAAAAAAGGGDARAAAEALASIASTAHAAAAARGGGGGGGGGPEGGDGRSVSGGVGFDPAALPAALLARGAAVDALVALRAAAHAASVAAAAARRRQAAATGGGGSGGGGGGNGAACDPLLVGGSSSDDGDGCGSDEEAAALRQGGAWGRRGGGHDSAPRSDRVARRRIRLAAVAHLYLTCWARAEAEAAAAEEAEGRDAAARTTRGGGGASDNGAETGVGAAAVAAAASICAAAARGAYGGGGTGLAASTAAPSPRRPASAASASSAAAASAARFDDNGGGVRGEPNDVADEATLRGLLSAARSVRNGTHPRRRAAWGLLRRAGDGSDGREYGGGKGEGGENGDDAEARAAVAAADRATAPSPARRTLAAVRAVGRRAARAVARHATRTPHPSHDALINQNTAGGSDAQRTEGAAQQEDAAQLLPPSLAAALPTSSLARVAAAAAASAAACAAATAAAAGCSDHCCCHASRLDDARTPHPPDELPPPPPLLLLRNDPFPPSKARFVACAALAARARRSASAQRAAAAAAGDAWRAAASVMDSIHDRRNVSPGVRARRDGLLRVASHDFPCGGALGALLALEGRHREAAEAEARAAVDGDGADDIAGDDDEGGGDCDVRAALLLRVLLHPPSDITPHDSPAPPHALHPGPTSVDRSTGGVDILSLRVGAMVRAWVGARNLPRAPLEAALSSIAARRGGADAPAVAAAVFGCPCAHTTGGESRNDREALPTCTGFFSAGFTSRLAARAAAAAAASFAVAHPMSSAELRAQIDANRLRNDGAEQHQQRGLTTAAAAVSSASLSSLVARIPAPLPAGLLSCSARSAFFFSCGHALPEADVDASVRDAVATIRSALRHPAGGEGEGGEAQLNATVALFEHEYSLHTAALGCPPCAAAALVEWVLHR